jgi:hypothetical protein
MGEYKTVGMSNEQRATLDNPPGVPFVPFVNPMPGNYIEPGILTEKQALASAKERRDENRPVGAPFVIPSPKNYSAVEQADKNPVSQQSEPRAIGKPFVQAPPPSRAEILQSAGKTYPPRKV